MEFIKLEVSPVLNFYRLQINWILHTPKLIRCETRHVSAPVTESKKLGGTSAVLLLYAIITIMSEMITSSFSVLLPILFYFCCVVIALTDARLPPLEDVLWGSRPKVSLVVCAVSVKGLTLTDRYDCTGSGRRHHRIPRHALLSAVSLSLPFFSFFRHDISIPACELCCCSTDGSWQEA